MKRPGNPRKTSGAEPRLRPRFQVMVGDDVAFGPGKADLPEQIRATGSIAAAALRLDRDSHVVALRTHQLRVANFREPDTGPPVPGYPDE